EGGPSGRVLNRIHHGLRGTSGPASVPEFGDAVQRDLGGPSLGCGAPRARESPRGGGQGAEAAGLASAGMAPRTPPGALPGAPEPAVVRCGVMKGGRSRTTRSGRLTALSFLSALLPSSIYL